MNILDAIYTPKSIRKFKDKLLAKEDIPDKPNRKPL